MRLAMLLTTTNPSILFPINKTFSLIPPLSSFNYTLQRLDHPHHRRHHPTLSIPSDAVTIRTAMLPLVKCTMTKSTPISCKGPWQQRNSVSEKKVPKLGHEWTHRHKARLRSKDGFREQKKKVKQGSRYKAVVDRECPADEVVRGDRNTRDQRRWRCRRLVVWKVVTAGISSGGGI
ncbi:hypothetical protein PIB30_007853 [Stylosanthes scabra]|uniref:Uncharacterized protein n=1 Tax=Stylosanthes scabra TaxID=79078 RepID=A0ABU6R576_9FABA|nr:hypothetical protein [Stylosanthes scabra]